MGHKFCPYVEHIRSAQNEDRSAQNEDRFARKEDGAAQNNLHSAQNVPCSPQKDQNMRFCTLVICKSGSLSFPGREMARQQRSNDLEREQNEDVTNHSQTSLGIPLLFCAEPRLFYAEQSSFCTERSLFCTDQFLFRTEHYSFFTERICSAY